MNPEEQQVFDIITRVTDWEEIPLQTRRDFLAHLLEINTLDEKALSFIWQTLDRFGNQESQRLNELKQDLTNYQATLETEQNQKTSWKHRIYQAAESRINKLTDTFKNGFRVAEKNWNHTEEAGEKALEQDQVTALKASVGA